MSVRRKSGRRACPSGKVRYRDRDAALHALRRIQGSDYVRDVMPTRVYVCSLCNGAHLTSKASR